MGRQRSREGRQRRTGTHTRQCVTHRSSWHRQETFTDPTLFSLPRRQVPRHSSPTRLPSGSHEEPMEAPSSQHRVLVVCSVGEGSERSFLATGTGHSLLEAPACGTPLDSLLRQFPFLSFLRQVCLGRPFRS